MSIRKGAVAGGLAALLALGAVACEVENGDLDDPMLDDNDLFEDDLDE